MHLVILPPPWRLFFWKLDLVTKGAFYQALCNAYSGRTPRLIQTENVLEWQADQDLGSIRLQCEDDKLIVARYQILGTFDGNTFLWGDNNPSLLEPLTRNAALARQLGRKEAWRLFDVESFPAQQRECDALMSLCGELLSAEALFFGPSGSCIVYMTLRDCVIKPSKSANLMQRVFSSPLEFVSWLLAQQLVKGAVAFDTLLEAEKKCEDIARAYKGKRYDAVLELVSECEAQLQPCMGEQEPGGWLYLTRACALAHQERYAEAISAYKQASRSWPVADHLAVSVGRLRCHRKLGQDEDAAHELLGAFIRSPVTLLPVLDDQERAQLKLHIEKAGERRQELLPGNDTNSEFGSPEAVVRAVIKELQGLNDESYRRGAAAEKQRRTSSQMCDADDIASRANDRHWRDVCLAWFTPERDPNLGSYSSESDHDPELENIVEVIAEGEGRISVTTITKKVTGMEGHWRYLLVHRSPLFMDQPEWRIEQVYSVWPEEELAMYE